ncbi:methyl-accepting chemotaxis protein [Gloeomargarita lithophora Alchichica-D10]|uniref:Methyl-accepting chemotaxis protein n=1 Tax=Gloeomargarita lithophora Alchichica-D10 TaxID=1188229 RepID=A0A1J0ADL6_9CYAN|nr:GAF domain-containing protein [Gloeomargarita lithophora]APB34038.1 methyl-accepting chemotaxis protein [Gloeomargarita lithophora Alchichica-D10]
MTRTPTKPQVATPAETIAANGSPALTHPEPAPPVRSLGQRLVALAMITGLCGAVAGVVTYNALLPQESTPQVQQKTLAGGAAALVGLLIGLAAAALLGQGFTKPALLLLQMAQRLRRGEWQARVSLPGEDELTHLGQELNALALQLQTLQEQQQSESQRTQKFRELVRQLRQTQDPQTVMDTAVREVRQILLCDRAVVYRFAPDWVGTVVAESVGRGWVQALSEKIDDPCFRGEYVTQYQAGRVQATADIYQAGLKNCHIQILERFQVKANLVTPILVEGNLLGLLIAHQCGEAREWSAGEQEFLAQVAVQVGFALDQAQLWQVQQTQMTQATQLNQIIAKMRESLNRQTIYNHTVRELRNGLKSDRCVVYLFDEKWQGTVVAESVHSNFPKALGAQIADPCFADRYVESYQAGRVKPTADIHNAGLTECHLQQLEPFQVKANLVAPILAEGKLLGLLINHQCSSTREWQSGEIELARQVALQMGFALDQAIALERQEELRQTQETKANLAQLLNDITLRIRQSLDRQAIFQTTVQQMREALESDRCVVYLFDATWKGTVMAESVAPGWPRALGAQIADPCFADNYVEKYQRGRVQATSDIYRAGLTECHLQQLEPFAVKANLVAPILLGNQLFGLLIAHQCSSPRRWQNGEIELIKQVAVQVGFALDQANLLTQQKAKAEQEQLLNRITSKIRESLERTTIYQTTVWEVKNALKSDRCVVYLFDKKWQGTVMAEALTPGYPPALGALIADPCFADKYVEQYRTGRVKATPDIYHAGLTPCHLQQLEPFAVKANLVAPILLGNTLYGLLIAHQCDAPRDWTELEIDFLGKVAVQVGFALDQAVALEQQETLRQQQELAATQAQLVNDITSKIRQSLQRTAIYNATVQEVRKALQSDRCVVYLFDATWKGTVMAESVAGAWPRALGAQIADPCFADNYVEKYRRGRVQATPDIYNAGLTECHLQQLEPFAVKANLVAPILGEGKLLGLLIAHQCSGPRTWQETEINFLRQVAAQVGFALDQAILLEQVEQSRQKAEAVSEEQKHQREAIQGQLAQFLGDIEGAFKGDLTVRARVTSGEMGTVADFFNAIVESLQQIVQQVQTAAQAVADTAQRSAPPVNALSSEAARQAQAIGAALDQIQQMVQSIQQVAANAHGAELQVQQANQTVQEGDEAMNRTVAGISAIRDTVAATAKKVKRLGEASQKISRVVNLISNFAAQTNLLALNAAIEAARAGEEGRGFAVVAEEVRSLAQQSASATGEIEQLVEEIQAETNEVVAAMEAGTEQVVVGTHLVAEARQRLSQIATVTSQISTLVGEIAQAAQAQSQTSAVVSRTMQDVAGIANQTSQQSVGVADSFTHLLGVAAELQENVAQFKVA